MALESALGKSNRLAYETLAQAGGNGIAKRVVMKRKARESYKLRITSFYVCLVDGVAKGHRKHDRGRVRHRTRFPARAVLPERVCWESLIFISQPLLHHLDELLEQVVAVGRTGARFRMILHRERGSFGARDALVRPVEK